MVGMAYMTSARRISSWLCLNDYHQLNYALTLGGRYFWHKSWGVQAQLLLNPGSGQEYLYDGKVLGFNQVEVSLGSIDGNFSAGIVYRCSIGNWDIQPSFGIGITGFSETGYSSYLKHEGTKTSISLCWRWRKTNVMLSPSLPEYSCSTICPSGSVFMPGFLI